ncbi:hypothetical protein [Acinetobacter seifertii]|uniref:Uncharacterized protein n=1 Tax=Acinetobacter seifertii TaxID=1530123 RepID=A0A7H2PQY6_9GAMM|nr:hypothetical protein [Acinetobacter seifertii]QNX05269.1 hypothetical protein IC796_18675 [Acinetobacter seifertii]QNX15714.1 hypothetical protein IC793_18175 [Acinetobacter seifertii]
MYKFLISLIILMGTFSITHAKDTMPKPSNFPVKSVYKGTTAKLDLSDPDARMFRTRLSEALKEQPDFAGEYVTVMWGCGTNCRVYSFINKRTGKLLKEGFGGEERQEDVIFTDPNSRLLVTKEEIRNDEYEVKSLTLRAYILEKNKFKLIKTITNIAPEEE